MKYRKKPVVIEAVQWTGNNHSVIYNFIANHDFQFREGKVYLKTLESDGEMQIADNYDYIIKGVEGEFYPCKPDIFKKTYAEV